MSLNFRDLEDDFMSPEDFGYDGNSLEGDLDELDRIEYLQRIRHNHERSHCTEDLNNSWEG